MAKIKSDFGRLAVHLKTQIKGSIAASWRSTFQDCDIRCGVPYPGIKASRNLIFRDANVASGGPTLHKLLMRIQCPTFRDAYPASERPTFRDAYPASERPTFRDAYPAPERPTFRDAYPVSERPTFQDADPASECPTFRDAYPASELPTFRDAGSWKLSNMRRHHSSA